MKNFQMIKILNALFLFYIYLSPVASWAGFPCDLDALAKKHGGKLPEIVLTGETHNDLFCIKDQDYFIKSAEAGKILLGLEGGQFGGNWGKNQFGLEEPYSYALAIFGTRVSVGMGYFSSDESAFEARGHMLNSILYNTTVNRIYREHRRLQKIETAASEDEKAISEIVDQIVKSPKKRESILGSLPQSHPWNQQTAFRSFATRLFGAVGRAASTEYKGEFEIPGNIQEYIRNKVNPSQFGMDESEKKKADLLGNRFVVEWRDQFFAKHIEQMYCQAAEKNIPLYAVMGVDHTPGVLKILEEKTVSYPIPIKTRLSQCDMQIFEDLLSGEMQNLAEVQVKYSHCPSVIQILQERGWVEREKTFSEKAASFFSWPKKQ